MSADTEPALQAITDARALLDALLAGGWQELHIISGTTEIFLARNGGGANPMRSTPPAPPQPVNASAPETEVTAPHVASIVDLLPVGTAVSAGEKIATLRLLDENEPLTSPIAGTIIRHGAGPGQLVDYGAILLAIRAA